MDVKEFHDERHHIIEYMRSRSCCFLLNFKLQQVLEILPIFDTLPRGFNKHLAKNMKNSLGIPTSILCISNSVQIILRLHECKIVSRGRHFGWHGVLRGLQRWSPWLHQGVLPRVPLRHHFQPPRFVLWLRFLTHTSVSGENQFNCTVAIAILKWNTKNIKVHVSGLEYVPGAAPTTKSGSLYFRFWNFLNPAKFGAACLLVIFFDCEFFLIFPRTYLHAHNFNKKKIK